MSDYRYALGKHQGIDCLHVLIDGDDGQMHIPLEDILAKAAEQGMLTQAPIGREHEPEHELLLRAYSLLYDISQPFKHVKRSQVNSWLAEVQAVMEAVERAQQWVSLDEPLRIAAIDGRTGSPERRWTATQAGCCSLP